MTYIHELADWPKLHKAQVWRQVNNHSVNDRQPQAINRMLADWRGHLTTSKYAKLAKCSTDTALRDIRSLTHCAPAGAAFRRLRLYGIRRRGNGAPTHFLPLPALASFAPRRICDLPGAELRQPVPK